MPEYDATVEYRVIPGLSERFYRAGSDGSLWTCQKKGKGAGKVGSWKRLRERIAGQGYLGLRLGENGVHTNYYSHILVLTAFAGPCPFGCEVCHNNGCRIDNRAENLRWGTRKENMQDTLLHGTRCMGSKTPWSVLTEEEIPVIRVRSEAGESDSVIAADYSVDPATIGDVVARRTWKQIP